MPDSFGTFGASAMILGGVGGLLGLIAGLILRCRPYTTGPSIGWLSVLAPSVVLAGSWWRLGTHQSGIELFTGLVFLSGGVIGAWIDLDVHRLPDWLTLPMVGLIAGAVVTYGFLYDEWGVVLRSFLAAAAVSGGLLVLSIVSSLGLGDVKLGISLGLVLGLLGWEAVLAGVLIGFISGAVVAVALLIGGRSSTSYLPLGPALVFGACCLLLR